MEPHCYKIICDKCGGSNITWSTKKRKIYCHNCKKDTKGIDGIFNGPIPVGLIKNLGLSLDRIDLITGEIIKDVNK